MPSSPGCGSAVHVVYRIAPEEPDLDCFDASRESTETETRRPA
jgi:hypothetical protein